MDAGQMRAAHGASAERHRVPLVPWLVLPCPDNKPPTPNPAPASPRIHYSPRSPLQPCQLSSPRMFMQAQMTSRQAQPKVSPRFGAQTKATPKDACTPEKGRNGREEPLTPRSARCSSIGSSTRRPNPLLGGRPRSSINSSAPQSPSRKSDGAAPCVRSHVRSFTFAGAEAHRNHGDVEHEVQCASFSSEGSALEIRMEELCNKAQLLLMDMSAAMAGHVGQKESGYATEVWSSAGQGGKPPKPPIQVETHERVSGSELTDLRFRISKIELELGRSQQGSAGVAQLKACVEDLQHQLQEARDELRESKVQLAELLSQVRRPDTPGADRSSSSGKRCLLASLSSSAGRGLSPQQPVPSAMSARSFGTEELLTARGYCPAVVKMSTLVRDRVEGPRIWNCAAAPQVAAPQRCVSAPVTRSFVSGSPAYSWGSRA